MAGAFRIEIPDADVAALSRFLGNNMHRSYYIMAVIAHEFGAQPR